VHGVIGGVASGRVRQDGHGRREMVPEGFRRPVGQADPPDGDGHQARPGRRQRPRHELRGLVFPRADEQPRRIRFSANDQCFVRYHRCPSV